MSISRLFEESNIDAEKGARLIRLLGVDLDEVLIQPKYSQFKDVLSYYGSIDGGFELARKMVAGKSVDRLNHLHEYFEIQAELSDKKDSLELKKDYAPEETIRDLKKEVSNLESEAKLYER